MTQFDGGRRRTETTRSSGGGFAKKMTAESPSLCLRVFLSVCLRALFQCRSGGADPSFGWGWLAHLSFLFWSPLPSFGRVFPLLSISFCPFRLLLLASLLLGHPHSNLQSRFSEMVCRASVHAQARVFPTPPPSRCLPLLALLLVDLHGLLSSGSRNSSSGCLISTVVAAYQVVLGVGCSDRRVGVRLEAWNWVNLEILLQRRRLSNSWFFRRSCGVSVLGPRCGLGLGFVCWAGPFCLYMYFCFWTLVCSGCKFVCFLW